MNARRNSEKTQQNPQDAERRLRIALGAGSMCVWEWNRRTGAIVLDGDVGNILGIRADRPLTPRGLFGPMDRQDRRRFLLDVRAALSSPAPLSTDIRIRRAGQSRWFAVRGKPALDDAGKVVGLVGVVYDVTEQKESLSRTDTLLREVSHRSKNMLALILATARLTAREAVDVRAYLKNFALRVAGLAASQDLIVAADWQNVDLGTLASAEIGAVARSDAGRITIAGPAFLVTPEAAQTLGMILTELAINAGEHGALTTAGGRVELEWKFPDDGTIEMSWRESGGPPYDPERPKGYGLAVVERFSTQGLKVSESITSDADGFSWVLYGPTTNIGTRPPQPRD